MAHRVGKRKRSSREDYMLHEALKIEEEVFDTRTMLRLKNMFSKGIISKLHFKIATGKEADIYLAEPGVNITAELVIIKIFRIETSAFRNRMRYIIGDPRFGRIKSDIYSIVNEWCKKEYGNLKFAEMAGIHAPKPYLFSGNVLAMEFIGTDGVPSKPLKETGTTNPKETLESILADVKKLYNSGLVHADLSEYNILMKGNVPYLIDFGQAVVLEHTNAMEFLRRDIDTILAYFSKNYKIEKNADDVFKLITGKAALPI